MKDFSQLKKNLKKDFSGLTRIKVALLGDSATQLLIQAIKGAGYDAGLDLELWEADFNQVERQVFDPQSELYGFQPDMVILFRSSHKLLGRYNKLKPEQHATLAESEMQLISGLQETLSAQLNVPIIYYNYTEIDDAVFGNYAAQIPSSFIFQLRKLNYDLMNLAVSGSNLYLCDLSSIQNRIGKASFFTPSVYINTEMVLGLDALPAVAQRTVDLIATLKGRIRKCVILDLDNTTWGGIIGADGLENIHVGRLGNGQGFP